MRKLFILLAGVAMIVPAFAAEITGTGDLGSGDVATLSVTADLARYAKVLSIDKSIVFTGTAVDPKLGVGSYKSADKAGINVEANVDMKVTTYMGSPLANTGNITGTYTGYALPTTLTVTFDGSFGPVGGPFAKIPALSPAVENHVLTQPGAAAKVNWMEHGDYSNGFGGNLVVEATITRAGLSDPAGAYAQGYKGGGGAFVADPATITFEDIN